jgi:5-methylcytosine-specific restriction endonuclease McrBC GTP-binding regulatory subunit McrB
MNLARVEYYFSDFLSAMELDGGSISLREAKEDASVDEEEDGTDVPARLTFPPNVLVIGTVNIDETTHGFSPKVLDRANVIVFNDVDAQRFLEGRGEAAASTFRLANSQLEPGTLANREAAAADALARGNDTVAFTEPLVQVHELLKNHNLHFGYRVLQEMTTYVGLALEQVEGEEDEIARTAFDLQLVQKVLPKFNGGRELEQPLSQLLAFCLDGRPRKEVDAAAILKEAQARLAIEPASAPMDEPIPVAEVETASDETTPEPQGDESVASGGTGEIEPKTPPPAPVVYPRASRDLARMLTRLRLSGFVAFLE